MDPVLQGSAGPEYAEVCQIEATKGPAPSEYSEVLPAKLVKHVKGSTSPPKEPYYDEPNTSH